MEFAFLRRGCMQVRKVLEDVGSVRRGVLVVESVDGRRGRLRPIGLCNVWVWYPKDGFRGVLVGGRLLGWLAGQARMSGGFWASVYKGGQRASAYRYAWICLCWRGSEKYLQRSDWYDCIWNRHHSWGSE
jgi:hypothetical protein